ncbi:MULTISPECIES: esterase [unclassified Mycobacterium]|uniref:esterase n=1 Tax=unclassified Mycobacterium TaxID=2642494 RepID=UPI0029C97E47|nr:MULTISPECIES: esterase [unclassified Mycobacterium]
MTRTPQHLGKVLIALISAAVVVAAAGCGTSSSPGAPGRPTAGAPSVCGELGGTLGLDQLCQVHASAADYTLDMSFPVDYPEQQAVTDYLKKQRDDFVDYVKKFPSTGRPAPYSLDVKGETYRSGTPESGTQSLVFDVDDDEGLAHEGHPDTSYDVFNYDLDKHAPITLDTLFKPGVNPVDLLSPIAAPILTEQFGAELIPALHEAGTKAYQNFAITDDAVTFFLGESQLRVSNSGPFQFSVPRDELDSALAITRGPRVHASARSRG